VPLNDPSVLSTVQLQMGSENGSSKSFHFAETSGTDFFVVNTVFERTTFSIFKLSQDRLPASQLLASLNLTNKCPKNIDGTWVRNYDLDDEKRLWLGEPDRDKFKTMLHKLMGDCNTKLGLAINEAAWGDYFKAIEEKRKKQIISNLITAGVLLPLGASHFQGAAGMILNAAPWTSGVVLDKMKTFLTNMAEKEFFAADMVKAVKDVVKPQLQSMADKVIKSYDEPSVAVTKAYELGKGVMVLQMDSQNEVLKLLPTMTNQEILTLTAQYTDKSPSAGQCTFESLTQTLAIMKSINHLSEKDYTYYPGLCKQDDLMYPLYFAEMKHAGGTSRFVRSKSAAYSMTKALQDLALLTAKQQNAAVRDADPAQPWDSTDSYIKHGKCPVMLKPRDPCDTDAECASNACARFSAYGNGIGDDSRRSSNKKYCCYNEDGWTSQWGAGQWQYCLNLNIGDHCWKREQCTSRNENSDCKNPSGDHCASTSSGMIDMGCTCQENERLS